MKSKFLYAILAFLISFGLWVYVVNVVSPESEVTIYGVPVTLTNLNGLEENGLMLLDSEVPSVDLVLQGNRSDLNKLSASNIAIYADLSKIYDSGKQKLTYNVIYPSGVNQDSITTLSKNPNMVTVSVTKRGTKDIPVKIDYEGILPEGFIADKENAVLDHAKITITGPEEEVNKIDHALIVANIDGRRETLNESYEYTLCDGTGTVVQDVSRIETQVSRVQLTLKIQQHKQIPLSLNVTYGGGANALNTVIKFDTDNIWVAGAETVLKDLNGIVLDSIDLGMIEDGAVLTYPVTLPAGVTNVSGNEEVNVTITFPNLKTKELKVSNIVALNVPEGMDAEILTKVLAVKIRGPQNKIDNLTEKDLTIRVDFAEQDLGTATVKAVVYVDSSFSGVGAVGNYSVSAILQAEADEDKVS